MDDTTRSIRTDPTLARSALERSLASAHLSGLTRWSPTGALLADLALEWHAARNATQWTFRLRPNVFWHDGTSLRAAQIVRSLHRAFSVRDPEGPFWALGPQVATVTRTGNDAIAIHLTSTLHELPAILAKTQYRIVNLDLVNTHPDSWTLAGTGPYRSVFAALNTGTTESQIVPGHWIEKPHERRLRLWRSPDPYFALDSVNRGSTALTGTILARNIAPLLAYIRGLDQVRLHATVTHNSPYIVLRHDKIPERLRLALKHAYPRQTIHDALRPIVQTADDAPTAYWENTPSEPGAPPSLSGDSSELRSTVSRYGLSRLTLHYVDFHTLCRPLADHLHRVCSNAGLRLHLKVHPDTDASWRFLRTTAALFIDYHRMQPTPCLEAAFTYHPESRLNRARFSDEAVTALIEKAWHTADPNERHALSLQALHLAGRTAGTLLPVLPRYLHATTRTHSPIPLLPFGELSSGQLPLHL